MPGATHVSKGLSRLGQGFISPPCLLYVFFFVRFVAEEREFRFQNNILYLLPPPLLPGFSGKQKEKLHVLFFWEVLAEKDELYDFRDLLPV